MWLIVAGIALVYEGIKQILDEEDGYQDGKKVGWHEHQLRKLAEGNPPPGLEERIRAIAREEAAGKRPPNSV